MNKIEKSPNVIITRQTPTEELKEQIMEGFRRQALSKTEYDEYGESITFIAKDGDVFAGAIVLQIIWGGLEIKHLYLEESYRGKGIGTRLMELALKYGRENHCFFSFVLTASFQARGFYEKLGFSLEFTRTGYRHGISAHYLRKDFKNE